ncbi:pilus modification protein PilV [Marichromatium purpuratum 984]|uniref:Pilus modification protein PilV n=1 Tax=Marichromatium purpuratum 984 TaxID=765910 RepID=W0DWI4_MARPU|nr:pilus modification protein PilV [Marichromatium purpuratum 984]
MIEVLVAVVILSIGLLGISGLQIRALKNNQSALHRNAAIIHAYSITEAMRAVPKRAKAGDFDITLSQDSPTGSSFPAVALAKWRERIDKSLGDGATGSVSCTGNSCTIIVQWDDSRGTSGSDQQQFTIELLL